MTRTVATTTLGRALRTGTAALLLGSVLAGCSGAASTPGAAPVTSGAVGATASASAPAAGLTAAPAASQAPAGRTADPVLANALTQLNALTSYQFKLTVKGGSYATSVGPAGLVGTVVNKPTFAVHFTYADTEIIEIQGNNWAKFGTDWVASKYGTLPTTYDSYGPANQLTHYFDLAVAPYYTAAGDETVNGVLATRYTATPQILSYMVGNWGVTAANGNSDSLVRAGDIWIAKTGGYPVRWNVTATGGVAGAGSGGSANFEYLLDITKANDAGNKIVVPAS